MITGADSGIGKAAAIQIVQKGYRVVMACRNKERGEAALADVHLPGDLGRGAGDNRQVLRRPHAHRELLRL
ncbi:MAG: SDR family NAD(P)-dependent oxidoreductase [Chloroflexota bacterium]|nr:MAG: SDR family NAD(P)-dependent oxidoreductase [Chloroflexota bacterium]